MIYLVYGGSGSGKSSFAEKILSELPEEKKYYIATMKVRPDDADAQKKIARHKQMRAGKGFLTIERPVNLDEITLSAGDGAGVGSTVEGSTSSALLECMSNLCANEMFDTEDGVPKSPEEVSGKIISGINNLAKLFENLVIVTNNIFEDGIEYDETTRAYINTLSNINCKLAAMADKVYEVVAGIPLELK